MAQHPEKHISKILALIDGVIEQVPKNDARYFVNRMLEELAARDAEIEDEIWNARQDIIYDLSEPREKS